MAQAYYGDSLEMLLGAARRNLRRLIAPMQQPGNRIIDLNTYRFMLIDPLNRLRLSGTFDQLVREVRRA